LNGEGAAERETVLLVAHGSAAESEWEGLAATLARRLRERRCFAAVDTAFLHARPSLAEVLDRIEGRDICVVPLLAGPGFHARRMIPAAIREFARTHPDRHVRLTEPLGTHPAYIESLADRVRDLAERAAIDFASCGFMAIGHGQADTDGADDMASRLAAGLEPDFAASLAVYLRGNPPAACWTTLTRTRDLLVVHALFGAGCHTQCDVPRLFGVSGLPARVNDRIAGPREHAGRRIWWATMPTAGAADADAVINLVLQNSIRPLALACQ